MKRSFFFILLLTCLGLFGANPDVNSILKAIDANMLYTSSISKTRMVIKTNRATRTVSSTNYSRGNTSFFTEYTAPPRDKGTKMLKSGANLWIYEPKSDRIVQISGNMLKQSVMGSDLSYEDFMEESSLRESYSATLEGSTVYDKRDCWKILLTAKKPNVTYHSRRIYVDKERYVPLYELWYAKSGKLLKTVRSGNVSRIGNRWYPRLINFKDELKEGSGTEYYIDSIQFDVSISDATFSKAKLKK